MPTLMYGINVYEYAWVTPLNPVYFQNVFRVQLSRSICTVLLLYLFFYCSTVYNLHNILCYIINFLIGH